MYATNGLNSTKPKKERQLSLVFRHTTDNQVCERLAVYSSVTRAPCPLRCA
jgi:hypothetical protein